MNKKELVIFLINNFTAENGNLDLSNLDFSEFGGTVRLSNMKVQGNLCQDCQKVKGNLFQDHQRVEGDLFQDFQKVKGDLFQDFQEVKGYLYEDELKERKNKK